jgi:hypothetical protein
VGQDKTIIASTANRFIPVRPVKDLAVEMREYAMPNDFSNWKDHDAFETAFARLLKDLRAEESRKA